MKDMRCWLMVSDRQYFVSHNLLSKYVVEFVQQITGDRCKEFNIILLVFHEIITKFKYSKWSTFYWARSIIFGKEKNRFLLTCWRSMTKIAGSGSISQRHWSADPDPYQNVMDPQHCISGKIISDPDPIMPKSVGSGSALLALPDKYQAAVAVLPVPSVHYSFIAYCTVSEE